MGPLLSNSLWSFLLLGQLQGKAGGGAERAGTRQPCARAPLPSLRRGRGAVRALGAALPLPPYPQLARAPQRPVAQVCRVEGKGKPAGSELGRHRCLFETAAFELE